MRQDQIKVFSIAVLPTVSGRWDPVNYLVLCWLPALSWHLHLPTSTLPSVLVGRWTWNVMSFGLLLQGEYMTVSDRCGFLHIWRNQWLIFPPQACCTLTVNLEHKSLHHLHLRRLWKSRGGRVANSSHLDKTACPLHVTLMDSFRSLPFSSDKAPKIHIVRNFLKIHWDYEYIFYFF